MAETVSNPNKGLAERVKRWSGWLLAAGIIVAPALAVIEGVHIGGINSGQDWQARLKKH